MAGLTEELVEIRANGPGRIARVLADRPRGCLPADGRKLMIIACDHPARGALAAGTDPMAMASRGAVRARGGAGRRRPGGDGCRAPPARAASRPLAARASTASSAPPTSSRTWRCWAPWTASSSTAR